MDGNFYASGDGTGSFPCAEHLRERERDIGTLCRGVLVSLQEIDDVVECISLASNWIPCVIETHVIHSMLS